MNRKSPITAGFLNLFFWGTGYSYAEIKAPLGLPWLVWPVAFVLWYAIVFGINYTLVQSLVLSLYGVGYPPTGNPFFLYQPVCRSYDYTLGTAICLLPDATYNLSALAAILGVQVLFGSPLAYDVVKRMGGLGGAVPAQTSLGPSTSSGRVCPQCAIPLDSVAVFCPQCGRNVEDVGSVGANITGTPPLTKRCDTCGTYNPSQYGFCKRCGGKLA